MGLAAFPAVWAAPTGAGRRALGLAKTTAVLPAVELRLTHKRDILQRQLVPGGFKKSSAAAETAHAPSGGQIAPLTSFVTLPRLTRAYRRGKRALSFVCDIAASHAT